jgi:hypothetical protein
VESVTAPATPPSPQPTDELEDLVADGPDNGDGDRSSITDVNGTVARFDMSYSPPTGERIFFGPPRSATIPGFVYLAFALVLVGLEAAAYTGSSNSRLYVWLVEGDRGRPLPSAVLAIIVFVSAVGTVLRAQMRGVVVKGDGVEARYLVALGLPRVRKWAWAQIHRMIFDETQIAFELWDGSYEKLPPVGDVARMRTALEALAARRKIPVTRLGKLREPG